MNRPQHIFIELLILWGACWISPVVSFNLERNFPLMLLIPNQSTTFTGFSIAPEPENSEKVSLFHVKINCSSAVQLAFKFEPYEHFCTKFGFKGTIPEINQTFSTMKITSPLILDNKSANIEYIVWRDQMPEDVQTALQTFEFEDSLKAAVPHGKVALEASKGAPTEQQVASIDTRFVQPGETSQFALALAGTKPDWLDFRFDRGNLILISRLSKDVQFDQIISFTIADKHSGLRSAAIALHVQTKSNEMATTYFIGFIIFFAAFCLILISTIVVCVAKIAAEPSVLKEQHAEFDASIIRNVLSDSITNWSHETTLKEYKPSAFSRTTNNQGTTCNQGTTFNDSILDLETLHQDLGSKNGFNEIKEQSFAVDNSFTYIIEFGNLSRISEFSDARTYNANHE